MPADRVFAEWEQAQRALAEAEMDVIRWRLRRASPPPPEKVAAIGKLRDRSNFLFEQALLVSSDPASGDVL